MGGRLFCGMALVSYGKGRLRITGFLRVLAKVRGARAEEVMTDLPYILCRRLSKRTYSCVRRTLSFCATGCGFRPINSRGRICRMSPSMCRSGRIVTLKDVISCVKGESRFMDVTEGCSFPGGIDLGSAPFLMGSNLTRRRTMGLQRSLHGVKVFTLVVEDKTRIRRIGGEKFLTKIFTH